MAEHSGVTEAQLNALVHIERVNSGLSVVGCVFIVVTFLVSKSFHRPINRLVFYASAGNLLTNIATIISRSAVDNENGFLCQGQAFLIQLFMVADVLWTLAMACNVYLTFYHKYDAERLKKMEKWYFLICYGIPFVPALTFIWARTPGKGRMYGNALLWCWTTSEYDVLRIATFYGPVWIAILATFAIYLRAGREIYHKRQQLREFGSEINVDNLPRNPFEEGAIHEQTEIAISYQNAHPVVDVNALGRQLSAADRRASDPPKGQPQYSVAVSAAPAVYRIGNMPPFPSIPKKPRTARGDKESKAAKIDDNPQRRFAAIEASRAAWGYTKVAVLFFSAMLITWIPSSANRVYSVVYPGQISIALTFASAFVLPLQGFWNFLIYTTTSLEACKELLGTMGVRRYRNGQSLNHHHHQSGNAFGMANMGRGTRLPSVGGDKDVSETDSTTELASRVASLERRG